MARKGTQPIAKWQARIKMAMEERDRKQPDWGEIYKYFRGTQWQGFKAGGAEDIVIVNLVYSHVKVIVPATYSRNPKLYMKPLRPDTVAQSRLTELILNQDMQRMKLKRTNKRIIQDVVLYGSGFSKTLMDLDNPVENPVDQVALEGLQRRFRNVSAASITGGEVGATKAEPGVYRTHPSDLVVAVGATDFGDPGFIAHRVIKRVGVVKKDKNYKNTKNLRPVMSMDETLRDQFRDIWDLNSDVDMGLTALWEIWDLDGTGDTFVIAEDHENYLVDPYQSDYPVDHPFDRLVFTPLDDQIWGESEILPWINNQDELNKIRTMQVSHLKRFNRKYAVITDHLDDEDELQQLEQGKDGAIVKLRGTSRVSDSVGAIQDAPMSPDMYRVGALVEDDIVKIGRITPYRRGQTTGANTATEANIAEANAQLGDVDRIDAANDFVLDQMEKVRLYRREFTPGIQIVQYSGDLTAQGKWEAWRREDIDIESQMHIEFGSSVPQSDQQRRSDAERLYDRLIQNPVTNPQAAATRLLEAYGERDMTGWFLPDPLIQVQLMSKVLGEQKTRGQSPTGGGAPPGAGQPEETEAELRGRAAPVGAE